MVKTMNTNEKGDIGLANVISDLINKGYFIFLPFSDTTHVDLIVADKKTMKTQRVQVKYISIDNNGVLNVVTSGVVNGKKVPVDLSKTDIWAIYCPNTKEVYYVTALELLGKKAMRLRINEPKQNQNNIRYAKNYLDLNKIWHIL
jgi:hypothetical protein